MNLVRKVTEARLWKNKYISSAFLAVVVLYPLRWTFTGLDLWDAGYNCINYIRFGPGYMNPSLFYSTFLANVTGRLFSLLPYGDTYAGLRFWCGLVICANVLVSALFCIRKIKLDRWAVILGELLAVSLCYSPTVILYNHLSFLILTVTMILLYIGLIEEKNICLAAAGFLLGLNVFVRFPNVTQTALILAVWYYLWLKGCGSKEVISKTLFCLAGFAASCILMYVIINGMYGNGSYFAGIQGLFGISEGAEDYSAASMITGMMGAYVRGFRRIADMAVFAAASFAIVAVIRKIRYKNAAKSDGTKWYEIIAGIIAGICLIIFSVTHMLMQFDFHHYITVILTAAMFIDLVMIICLFVMISSKADIGKRLISSLLIMQIIVLSVGSNTGISPVMNNMFLITPFMVHYMYLFLSGSENAVGMPEGSYAPEKIRTISPALRRISALVVTIAIAAYYIQCVMFGLGYVYEDAKNGIGGRASVIDNRVLSGIRMNEERAEWMQGLTDYINEGQLAGHDVIVYGYAPALVYYLSLEPVIGSWPDLDSYAASSMRTDMNALEEHIDKKEAECPIIIFDDRNIKEQQEHNAEKWKILSDFMDKYDYKKTFSNSRFSIYENKY
ncbi:MAG: hypothetical protein IJT80_11040 [Lachnospiraceae bacterium]|nr:hypothetical protein [Lachnospiraceae bacterium]